VRLFFFGLWPFKSFDPSITFGRTRGVPSTKTPENRSPCLRLLSCLYSRSSLTFTRPNFFFTPLPVLSCRPQAKNGYRGWTFQTVVFLFSKTSRPQLPKERGLIIEEEITVFFTFYGIQTESISKRVRSRSLNIYPFPRWSERCFPSLQTELAVPKWDATFSPFLPPSNFITPSPGASFAW